jgi:cytidylate kinase
MIIAVDGPAGSGKGTISEYLALKYDLLYLDTGLLYRAVAKAVLRLNIDPAKISEVTNVARNITLKDVQDPDLRGEEIAAIASQIAVISEVRQVLDEFQRAFYRSVHPPYKGAILDGRDIGTVICPDADCKLFITARPEIRNQRRMLETQVSSSASQETLNTIAQKIAERDNRDSTRKIAPLTPAKDAFIIDTSDLTIEQACTEAAKYVEQCCLK